MQNILAYSLLVISSARGTPGVPMTPPSRIQNNIDPIEPSPPASEGPEQAYCPAVSASATKRSNWGEWLRTHGCQGPRDNALLTGNVRQLSLPRRLLTPEKALDNFQLLAHASPEERERVWPLVRMILEEEGYSLPPHRAESYGDFEAWVHEHGELFPERVRSLRHMLTLMNRSQDLVHLGEERPIAVVFVCSSDHNAATTLRGGFPLLDTLMTDGSFDVVYFEIREESEVETRMRELTAMSGRRVHTLIFEGHGTPGSLAWDGEDPTTAVATGEDDWLDTGDIASGEMDFLRDMVEPNGQLFVMSCSGGAGGAGSPNLVNRFADLLRGRDVIGFPAPANLLRLRVEGSSHRLHMDLTAGEPYLSRYEPEDPGLVILPRDLQNTANVPS